MTDVMVCRAASDGVPPFSIPGRPREVKRMIPSAAAVPGANPVCADILRAVGLGLLWSDDEGPTERIDADLLERVSPYQRVVIRTAQAIHDGRLPTQAADWLGLR